MVQMEKCKFSAKRLSFYIDGQLSDTSRLIVENHLSKCKYCQNEAILLYNASLALRSFPIVKIPPTLDRNFTKKLHNTKAIK